MKFVDIKYVYFIGIGGIGMSGLARYFNMMGKIVGGYDRNSSALTVELESEGIKIHYKDSMDMVPSEFKDLANKSTTLIVYTPAVANSHSELVHFKNSYYVIKKRAEVLGIIADAKRTIAIAGTHGKTTTTTMVSHLFKHSSNSCNAFLGGISKNYLTNLLLDSNSEYVVVEADEFDRSFLHLHPESAIITSIDADHLDIYGTYEAIRDSFAEFVSQIKTGGNLIYKKSINIAKLRNDINYFTYSIVDNTADFHARNIQIRDGRFFFDWYALGKSYLNFEMGVPGRVNIENIVAALAIASIHGVNEQGLRLASQSFQGVKRRFDYQIKTGKVVYIDDYAHHPEELKACITSIREMYPNKEITGIFQPHLFSRTKDFANEFAESLSLLDVSILLPIYPARELPIEGVSSQLIFDSIKSRRKVMLLEEELAIYLEKNSVEVLLTMGAGSIDSHIPLIKQVLKAKYKI